MSDYSELPFFFFFCQIKLSVGKEHQCHPLTAQIIPAHLAAVAAAATINSVTHRTSHSTNHTLTPALFQTQTLPSALFRPAPGPVRTSHPQVLFAPYWPVWHRRFCTASCQGPNRMTHLKPRSQQTSVFHLYIQDTQHFHTADGPFTFHTPSHMDYLTFKAEPSLSYCNQWLPNVDLHCTAIIYKTNPVNYAVSLLHNPVHSLSRK